jgi:hypothetical protein
MTGDQELLALIARSAEAIQATDVDWLLNELNDQYWRMRVIEGLVLMRDERVLHYVHTYPFEFVYAVGRLQAKEFAHVIRRVMRSHPKDCELLSLSAWALGKLADREGVAEIRRSLTQRGQARLTLPG